ncbi:CAP domain-containing protein [Streptomyces sp. NPDC048350]|uniref:CAP domain-containing protein n=1 Tax=Streptomyces sp. NPDC048350 TaxID=3365538 RepID=UPI003712061D
MTVAPAGSPLPPDRPAAPEQRAEPMQHHDEPRPDEQRTHGGGRHRRGGSPRRHGRRAPSFRTAVALAGTATVALTVAAGAYVASMGDPSAVDTRSEEVALTNVAPLIGRSEPPAAPPSAPVSPTPAKAVPSGAAVSVPPSAHRSAVSAPAPAPKESAPASAPPAQTPVRAPAPENAVAPVPKAGGGGKAAQFVEQVVALANTEREKAGCSPLRADGRLHESAQAHADDMADRDYYGHTTPEGRDAGDRITAAGYTWSSWAENIHRGPKTPVEAMEDWMKSDGHRRNILNCSFKDVGVGVTLTSNGPWWVQNFGVRR